MMYLIAQLAGLLLLTAAFAALAGWAFAALRAAPQEERMRRERNGLLRDLVGLTSAANDTEDRVGIERERDVSRHMAELNAGRITELEQLLEAARERANEAAARAAELERAHDEPPPIQAVVAPSPPKEEASLQSWRLRYFEQRVRYLESARPSEPAAPEPPLNDWRARVAEAEASYLADDIRSRMTIAEPAQAASEPEPFAANANVDALLRWRMLYLERRLKYVQEALEEAPAPAPVAPELVESAPDPDRWKWRARYLEARTRHLEQRLANAETRAAPTPAPVAEFAEPQAPELPRLRKVKPPTLGAARNGAPDDFTLIDGVSQLQQTTLYSTGVFHFDQVAAWTPEHVAWVADYLRLGDRIVEEEWVEQAADLAREGPLAARRELEEEDA